MEASSSSSIKDLIFHESSTIQLVQFSRFEIDTSGVSYFAIFVKIERLLANTLISLLTNRSFIFENRRKRLYLSKLTIS